MSYGHIEINNPRLKAASDVCLAIFDGTDPSTDATERGQKLAAVRGLVAIEQQNLRERMVLPKIRALEAKLIEGDAQKQIAA